MHGEGQRAAGATVREWGTLRVCFAKELRQVFRQTLMPSILDWAFKEVRKTFR